METEITVPWGNIAVKIWGNLSDQNVIVMHGLMDNAGSFDRLIPLLPKAFCYICVDLPGHGRSTSFPEFFPVYAVNFVLALRFLVKHFDKKKYIILGHSYGGQIGLLFTQLYPEIVEKLAMVDIIHLLPIEPKDFKSHLRRIFEYCLVHQESTKPKFTYEEGLEKIQQRSYGKISAGTARILLPRGIRPVGGAKYELNVDPRTINYINPLHGISYIMEVLADLKATCPILIILASGSRQFHKRFFSILDLLKSYKTVVVEEVEGDHDLHNNDAKLVAGLLSTFLLNQQGKL